MMREYKNHTKLAGILFLVAMAASLIGGTLIQEVLDKPNLATAIVSEKQTILFGSVLELINAFAVVGIVVAFWKPLKQQNAKLMTGYSVVRAIEAAACMAAAIIPMAMIVSSGSNNMAFTNELISIRGMLVSYVVPLFFGIGGFLLYTMLLQSHLVPKYIAVWGLIATIGVMLNMFVSTAGIKPVLALPIIINEIYLGIYLVVKGFATHRLPAAPIKSAPFH